MKILDGSLVEEVFGTPDDIEQSKGQPLDPVVEAEHETDGVLYMSGEPPPFSFPCAKRVCMCVFVCPLPSPPPTHTHES